MRKAARIGLGVIAGAAVWAAAWLVGTRAAQTVWPDRLAPNRPITDTGLLLGYVGYSVLLSLLAGFVCARAGGAHARPAVGLLAALQLGLGVMAEMSYWDLMPAWYHWVFLSLIVPATLSGGWLGSPRQAGPARRQRHSPGGARAG